MKIYIIRTISTCNDKKYLSVHVLTDIFNINRYRHSKAFISSSCIQSDIFVYINKLKYKHYINITNENRSSRHKINLMVRKIEETDFESKLQLKYWNSHFPCFNRAQKEFNQRLQIGAQKEFNLHTVYLVILKQIKTLVWRLSSSLSPNLNSSWSSFL